jgi:[ribosomal protein S5]-alanine N-acetyltransferase
MMMWTRRKSPLQTLEDVILVADDVVLRPAISDDCREWLTVRRKNALYLRPYEPAWPADALTPEFFVRRLSRLSRDWQEDRSYGFLIIHKDTGELIGGINVNNVTRGAAQYATLGYWIDESLQGKGYMRQAGQEVLRFCFEKLALGRVNAACMPHNLRSKNLLLKLGFVEEGFARRYLQINGKREDHILFGLNVDDYLRGAGQA